MYTISQLGVPTLKAETFDIAFIIITIIRYPSKPNVKCQIESIRPQLGANVLKIIRELKETKDSKHSNRVSNSEQTSHRLLLTKQISVCRYVLYRIWNWSKSNQIRYYLDVENAIYQGTSDYKCGHFKLNSTS